MLSLLLSRQMLTEILFPCASAVEALSWLSAEPLRRTRTKCMNPSSILCVAARWIADTGVEPNLRSICDHPPRTLAYGQADKLTRATKQLAMKKSTATT